MCHCGVSVETMYVILFIVFLATIYSVMIEKNKWL
jgi:hypothetical protein